jgi:hypothetical protein
LNIISLLLFNNNIKNVDKIEDVRVTKRIKFYIGNSPLRAPCTLCTKLIIWEDSSTGHHNKTPTENGQLMGNPVYT